MKILSPATCIPPLDRLDYGVVPKNMQDRKQKMKWTKWLMFAVPVLAAAAVLSAIPITVVFLLAQRWLVNGLTAGGVKG